MSRDLPWLVACAAVAAPTMLAFNVSPSATFYNQALALIGWGLCLAVAGGSGRSLSQLGRRAAPPLAALGLLCAASAWAGAAALPSSLGLSLAASFAAAAWIAIAGAADAPETGAGRPLTAILWACTIAALLGAAVAFIQVFLPALPDGTWIARSGIPGRAVGNLRQPNHLSSVLLWGCVAVVALLELRRLGARAAAVCLAGLIAAVVLTASRTGVLSVGLLAVWGLLDRRLSRVARALLLAAPLVYLAAWQGVALWAEATQQVFGGAARLAETDISGSRLAIWRDTLELIGQQPWAGVGLGNFNFAWSLTPLPQRPTAFFDHAHNLPLHLAAELGVPLAALVVGLLLWGLWRIVAAARHAEGERGTALRFALVFLLMIGLHSLLEYPLWYAHFLLPTAWVLGLALGLAAPGASGQPRWTGRGPGRLLPLGGLALAIGAVLAVVDYHRVTAIFDSAGAERTLEERIASGQRSVLFAHHADYAAVTVQRDPPAPPEAFRRATHYLLDTRLMTAWAESLAHHGRVDQARHLAARLREFRNPASKPFFADCPDQALPAAQATAQGLPFQCALPERAWTWRDFLE